MEHYSNEEGTPKEGYLTKQSAIEAMHVMQYKYNEPFNVYICNTCGKYHIGRIRGEKMEQNQATLENEPKITRPFYKCVKSHSGKGFVKELNKAQKEGYRPIWDSREITRDNHTEPASILRTVMTYDTEAEPMETDPVEIEIIEALDLAEGYLIETTTSLADEKNRLLIDTDYDIVNAERHEKGLPAVKTAPEKKAWVDNQLSQRTLDAKEATRWKKYVEAMAKRGELPQRESPWERKAREKEEQLQAMDEKASEVYVEKVGAEPMVSDTNG